MSRMTRATAPKIEPEFIKADLYKALECAQSLGIMKRAVRDTAKQLVRFIPLNAAKPISPVRVNRLAAEEGCNVRTIHNHIKILINLGLAKNRSLDGGHRSFDHKFGDITFIAGIDLSPLLDHLPRLMQDCALRDAERAEYDAIRKRVSVVRRQIKTAIRGLMRVPDTILTAFDAMPRRVADMGIDDLLDLYTACVDMLSELKVIISKNSEKESDQSEKNTLLYTNTKYSSVLCNEGKPLMRNAKEPLNADFVPSHETTVPDDRPKDEGGQLSASEPSSESDVITLDLVANAAPSDWLDDINALYGDVTWQSLYHIAAARADANGIYAKLWANACKNYGQDIPTILSLILDHYGPSGTDHIKNPAGWMISMLRRVHGGQAHLAKSLFGIIKAQGGAV